MHKYLLYVQRKLNASSAHLRVFLQRFTGRMMPALGLMSLFVVPSLALGWSYLATAASSASAVKAHATAEQFEATMPNIISQPFPQINSPTTDQPATAANNSHSVTTKLKVDGNTIPVPQNGTVHQEIQQSNGTTTIDISTSSTTSGSAQTNSMMNIQLDSHSKSSSEQSP